MKLENIKAALKARVDSLKLNPQVPATPVVIDAIVVPDRAVISKIDNPAEEFRRQSQVVAANSAYHDSRANSTR